MKETSFYRQQAVALVDQMTVEEQASQLTYNSPAIERLNIPRYNWWSEALHGVARAGVATSFPQAIGLAATFDKDLLEDIANTIATEGRAKYNTYSKEDDRDIYKGLTFWSPNINIFRDPRWGRGHETYGEDPFLSGELGSAFINGLQGDGEYMKAAACAKHFAVHSGPEDLRHEFNAVVNQKDLWETYLPAFEKCITKTNVESVMGAYNRTNGEPCCGSKTLLKDILRDKWGFEGHVVSDCWAIKDFHMGHNVTNTALESVALAIENGCDLNCGNLYLHLIHAYQEGLVTKEQIREAAIRLFTTRIKLGLFTKTEYDEIPFEVIECKEHIETSIKSCEKGVVMLKNDGVLPLKKKELKTIGVIGPNANSRLALKGNYYGTASRYTTILEGIQKEVSDEVRVLYSKGCELVNDRSEPLALAHDRESEARIVAKHSDVVVLCLGLDETLEGEEGDEGNAYKSGDKKDLKLPEVQQRLLKQITEIGKPVILCMVTGSAMELQYAGDNCSAVLQTWYPGAYGGTAIANLLFGKVSPSGKLPITFYESSEELPEFTDYAMKGRTYRFMIQPALYPFGYGLTYGNVQAKEVKVNGVEGNKTSMNVDSELNLEAVFCNQGKVATEEVAQVYIKSLDVEGAVLNYSLCGFKRFFIEADGEETVTFSIPWEHFLTVDDNGDKVLYGKRYELYVGISQPDEVSVKLTGTKPITVSVDLI